METRIINDGLYWVIQRKWMWIWVTMKTNSWQILPSGGGYWKPAKFNSEKEAEYYLKYKTFLYVY